MTDRPETHATVDMEEARRLAEIWTRHETVDRGLVGDDLDFIARALLAALDENERLRVREAEQKRKCLGEQFRRVLEPVEGVLDVDVKDTGEAVYVTVTTATLDMELDLVLQRIMVEAAADWPEIDAWSLRTRCVARAVLAPEGAS